MDLATATMVKATEPASWARGAPHCYARWHPVETPDKKPEWRHLAKMFICRILSPWFYSDAADDPVHINVLPHGERIGKIGAAVFSKLAWDQPGAPSPARSLFFSSWQELPSGPFCCFAHRNFKIPILWMFGVLRARVCGRGTPDLLSQCAKQVTGGIN